MMFFKTVIGGFVASGHSDAWWLPVARDQKEIGHSPARDGQSPARQVAAGHGATVKRLPDILS
jgi:hypothetical protein